MAPNKDNNEQHILEIIERSKRNEATTQDLQELDQWYSSFEHEPLYTDGLSVNAEEEAMQMLLGRIHSAIGLEVKPKVNKSWYLHKWAVAVAAVIILISGVAVFFLLEKDKPGVRNSISNAGHILPGTNTATLTLSDGRKIKLSGMANGDLAKEAGVIITKTADGKLVYEIQNAAAETNHINIISTAIGETYQVRFSDGTAVWLNAASSLKFPARFSKQSSRIVELHGEAYFEVAKDKLHRFVVKTREQEVKVLGTHFNINSYPDEPKIVTTLLEGSVQVSLSNYAKTNAQLKDVLLKPGQQSILTNNSIKIAEVQTDDIIAWKNGYFMFNNESMESVMRKLSRWYNIEVQYMDPAVKQIRFFGTVSRFIEVSKVLEMLELTREVKFEIKGKQITVIKN